MKQNLRRRAWLLAAAVLITALAAPAAMAQAVLRVTAIPDEAPTKRRPSWHASSRRSASTSKRSWA